MKNEAISPAKDKDVAVHEVSLDSMFQQMSQWSDRIAQRAYEFFVNSGFTDGHDVDDWFRAEHELLQPVALDVKDSKDEYVVKAEIPGFDAQELDIRVNGSHLVIEGKHDTTKEKKAKGQDAIYSEHKSQQICRMIELPAPILGEKAHAELKNGVLELTLPKAEKPQQIKVSAA
ncbi:MAG TPA: Hsp20 family protein [Candidatus Angelobacter sp.]|nr:Hsp20 family protein [Candidatus Angelobacter sp.]